MKANDRPPAWLGNPFICGMETPPISSMQVKQLEAAATQETELSQPRSSGNYSGSGSESLGRLYPRPASAPSLASERLEESRVSN